MYVLRSSALIALSALAIVACGSSSSSPSTDTTSSALVVDKPDSTPSSSTIASADGTCTSIDDLVEANADALKALCGPGQIPVPKDVTADGCAEGSATSVTFTCVTAKHGPKPPKDGCQDFEVQDDHKAMSEKGGEHVKRMPPVVCPMLGHAAPPHGQRSCDRDGDGDGGDHRPPPPPPGSDGGAPEGAGGPPPPPPADGSAPPPRGDGDHDGPKGEHEHGKKGPPKIRCCAPPPAPKGGPGGGAGGGSEPPHGGPGGGGAPPAPPAPPASGDGSASSASSSPT